MSDLDPVISESGDTAPMPPATSSAALAPAPRPRVRTGAVLWGLVLVAAGIIVLWLGASPARRAAALDAVLGFDAFSWTAVGAVAIGGILTLVALAAVIRHLQKGTATRSGDD